MDLQVFDMSHFLKEGKDVDLCKSMAESMHKSGILIVKDPRVTEQDNNNFIDMMEKYFEQDSTIKILDARPDIFYQVGATPEFIELPRCSQEPDCLKRISEMPESHRPQIPTGPDCKERFFWRMGQPPPQTQFKELNAPPVIPKHFGSEWEKVMNTWGTKMLDALTIAARMVAIGFGMQEDSFTQRMNYAPHLLAPTGTDLSRFGDLGRVIAGFHYDLNLFSIHGKSRYPGLYIWLRTGEKVLVKVPDGCLLIQGGKQLEILTGGETLPGEHEVVVSKETIEKIERVKRENEAVEKTGEGKRQSLWRISSTLFGHVASDVELKPLPPFDTEERRKKYPPILTGHQVQAELDMIKLAKQTQ